MKKSAIKKHLKEDINEEKKEISSEKKGINKDKALLKRLSEKKKNDRF